MTNEEAKILLQSAKLMLLGADGQPVSDLYYAVEKGIEALETIPKYKDAYNKGWDDGAKASYEHLKMCEEEQSGDLISRDELLKAIDTWDKFGCDADTKLVPYQDHYIPYIHYDDVIKCIKGMPSVNPQKPYDFVKWVATEIFDDNWEYNKDAFAEIACRKLAKLGIVRAKGDEWEMVEPQESEEISGTNLKMWQEIFKVERGDKE